MALDMLTQVWKFLPRPLHPYTLLLFPSLLLLLPPTLPLLSFKSISKAELNLPQRPWTSPATQLEAQRCAIAMMCIPTLYLCHSQESGVPPSVMKHGAHERWTLGSDRLERKPVSSSYYVTLGKLLNPLGSSRVKWKPWSSYLIGLLCGGCERKYAQDTACHIVKAQRSIANTIGCGHFNLQWEPREAGTLCHESHVHSVLNP